MSEDYTHAMDDNFSVNIKNIGVSSNPMQNQVEALKARIFHGASSVELGFMGQGKTNSQQPGPESMGSKEREDMRAQAMSAGVKTSTHATTGIAGLSGFDGRGEYSSQQQKNSMDELKKAIDFASEASTGGAIVFHTGEGPRSMWSTFDKQFKLHHKEEEEEIHYLIDPEEKKISGGVKEDNFVYIPEQEKNPDGSLKFVLDENGNQVLDELTGKPMPIFKQSKSGDFITHKKYFRDYRKEKEEEQRKKGLDPSAPENRKDIIKEFFTYQQELNIQYQLGQSRYYLDHYAGAVKERDKLIDALKYYKDLKSKMTEDEYKKHFERDDPNARSIAAQLGYTIPDRTDPVKFLEEKLNDNVREIGYGREIASSGIRQAKDMYEKVKNSEFLEEFAVREASKQMADAAIYAFEKTQERIRQGDKIIEKNPLYISPEGWQPEDLGSHPEEIRKLVEKARAKVVEDLTDQYGEVKAKKIAKQSIKATIDVGHLNTWKRFFVRKKDEKGKLESQENFDKRFNNWLLTETEKLAKDGIVGHVHLSDNFGYHDEHLTPGQGSAPIKEFVGMMKKHGVDDFIVEGGSFNVNTAMPETWTHLGSPIYRVGDGYGGSSVATWGDVHQSYFGRTQGPTYIVGDYAPSDDFKGSPFYSGLPLE